MAIVFSNNARTTLASNISNSATTITVADGSVFPSLTGGDIFYCTIDDGTNNEIVEVTAISSNTLTVVRGQDNTTARAFVSGDLIELRLVAKVLETFPQLDAGEVTADEFIGDLRGAVIFKAEASEAVSKGDVVYVSGISGNTPVVALADADFTSKMPAFGLVLTAASANGSTEVVTFGTISGLDTSSFSVGDTLYVSTTAGALTNSKPTGEASLIQNIGMVQRSHATAGSIKVGGAGRTATTPNLNDGNIFIGNASNQATTASLNTKIEDYLDANGTTFPDSVKAQFGASNDLQIYHNGTHSYIDDAGIGNLYIRASQSIALQKADGTEDYLTANNNGAVTLYYNNSPKIATTSTGIDVTGTVTADGLDLGDNSVLNVDTIALDKIKGDADDNTNITFAGSDTTTFTQGGSQVIAVNTTGLTVTGTISSGDIEIGTSASYTPVSALAINEAVNTPAIEIIPTTDENSSNTASIRLWGTRFGTANRYSEIKNITDGSTANNELVFDTNGNEALRLDSSQNATFAGSISSGVITSTGTKDSTNFILQAPLHTVGGGSLADYNEILFDNSYLTGTTGQVYIRHLANSHNDSEGAIAFGTTSTSGTTSEALRIRGDNSAIFAGDITTSGDIDLTGTSDTSSEKIMLPRSGYIAFYGNTDLSHAISSMGTDDIRINSYGEIILNLDSNENQTSAANFRIIKHGGSSSAGTSVFTIDGENGNATFSGTIDSGAILSTQANNNDIEVRSVGDYFPSLTIARTSGTTKTNYEWNLQIGSSGYLNFKDITNGYYPLIFRNNGDVYLGNNTSAASPVLLLDQSAASATFAGTISSGAVANIYTSSDRGYFVAGTNDASNQHLYFGSYHGTTLKELTFSGSNNGFYPQTDASIDLGLSSKKFKNLYLSGTGTFDTQVFLPPQGTANSTTTAYESAALVLQGSGWDTNGSVARAGSWTIKNVPTASVYPEFDLNFYEEGNELRFQLHGRGTGGYVDPSAATFHGNVNINADSSGSSGAGAGNLTVAGAINMGTDSGDPFNSQSVIKIQDGGNAYIQIKAGTSAAGGLLIGDTDDDFVGGFLYSNSNDTFSLYSGNAVAVSFNSSQNAVFAGTISSSSITSSGNLTTSGYVTIDSTTDGKLRLKVPSGEVNDWNYIEFYGADNTRDGYVGTDADGDMKFFSDKNSSELRLESTGATISTNLTVTGDLTVNGTTTTVNQTNLDVSDNLIGLNRGASSNANDSGILIERGSTGDNVFIGYDESTDKITFATTTNVPSDTGNLTLTAAPIQASSIGVTNIVTNKVVKYNGSILDDSMITDNGTSVGIDQPSPSSTYKLDVSGAVRSSTTSPSFTLQETDSSNQTWALGSYAGTAAIRDITGGTYPLQILTGSPTNSVRIESTKVVISSALESSGTISYNPDVGGDLTLGNDGTYGTHTNGRYLTLGFGGTTNGYNRIFAGNTADAPLFINSATGRGIYFRTNGGSADSVIIDTTAGIRSRGQVRATGWYGSQSSDNNGLAAEIGVSGSTAYLLSYNRSSSAYGALRLEGAGITFDPRGSTFTITNSSYVQSDSDIRAASSRVRIGNPSTLSGRSGIRIDTTGDSAADLLFGDNTGSTGWSNVNWALSSRATNDNQTFRIYRGSGQPSPYNSEAVAVEIARDLNMTLGKGLVLGSSSTLTIPSHAGFEIDITGSTAGNIRANSDLYILSQTGVLRLGAGGTNSQISLATSGNATFAGNVALAKANPVLILNDTTASSNADQVAYISFQDNGSEEAWVGWGSTGNTDLTIKNNIGSVVLDGTGTTVINDNLDLNGNADISGTLTAAGDITAGSGTLTVQATGYGGGQIGLGDWTNTNPIGISEGLWNSVTSDNDFVTVYARQHFNIRGYSGGTTHWLTLNSSALNLVQSQALQLNGTTVIDSSANITGNNLVRSNSRVSSSHKYPPGHYSKGDQVFAIDPTWSESELQSFFNSTSVSWSAQSDAPGGYAIYINGSTSVGGVYGSGFGHIPIETGDIFYMECWIKNVGTVTHYMGSNEFNENFGNVGGNPGSFGYWTMSNTNPGTSWVKVSGYISNVSGTGTTTGQFDIGAKYWTPMALFNYTNSSGTRACYISGWKVYRVNRGSPLWITQSNRQDVTAADTISSYSGSVGSGWTPMALVDNNSKPGHPLVIKNSRSDYWSMGIDTHSYGIYARAYSANTRSILQGTDTAGNVVFDAGFDGDLAIGGDISMAGLYAGTWGPSSSSSVGRIGQVTDRVTGSITNQIGGSTSAKWEIVDYGWTAVLMQCDNSGNTYIGGSLGIGVSPDTSHSLKISSNDNEPLEILSSAGGCWINVQGSGSQVMSMGVDTNGWAIYDRTNSAYRIRVANNGQLQTLQGIANSSSYSQTGGSFSTAGATEVRLTDGTERVRIQGYDLLGYGAGGNGLWVISNVTANASNQTTLTLGTEWDWDDSISFKYVPAASGSAGGVLTIGQAQKNSTSWNHNTTNFSFNGSTIFQFANTSRLEMRPTSSSGGERVYYAAGSYTANTSATFQDVRMVGTQPVDHKYVRDSSGNYGYKQENWWDGNSYQSIRQQNDAFRFSVDVIAFDTSDKRLKNNITPIENCLDKVSKLGAYEFEWDETKQRRFKGFDTGVIAQEVEEVYPHMVETREDGYKALQYEKLVPLLLGAIKEQQEQIESLKSEVDNLKGEK